MKRRVITGVLFLLLLPCGARLAAADTVRIIAAEAAIRLNADPNSLTLATVPAGTVLEVNGRQGAWYSVWLPSEREGGPRRLGFLAASDAELIDDARLPQAVAAPPEAPDDTQSLPPPPRGSSGDFDGFGGITFNLPGARAVVVGPAGTADSGAHNILPTFGLSIGAWFGGRRVFGVFFDVSGINGGSAFAQAGTNNRSEVSVSALDFHGGWQFQYPGRIVRPYALCGVGVFLQTTTGAITLQGVPVSSIDQTDHFLSFVCGGGARFMIGGRWGVRVGLDAREVRVADGEYVHFGRFLGGTFLSF